MQTPPWTQARRDEAIKRGPHQSAKEHTEFVREEFADFVRKKFWTILPYRLVKHIRNLRLSPLGVVPQRERRPRLIVDLSFFDVNQECVPVAPNDAMQFGRTLQRLLQAILDADPKHGPVLLAKIDISDGFYRIRVAPRDVPTLGVLLPSFDGEEPMVALPLVLPMGWVNSPPFFSAVTETAADVMNHHLRQRAEDETAPHRLEHTALNSGEPQHDKETTPKGHRVQPPRRRRPTKAVDVYVDDFIALLQGDDDAQRRVMRTLLRVLDHFFRPASDPSEYRQEPASVKKLKKGDAQWATTKVVLGWLINTVAGTIELPTHRRERLKEILDSIRPQQRRIGVKAWHKVLGELRSMVIAIPGARGLFSTLQQAIKTDQAGRPARVRLTRAVHQFLDDFRLLATKLGERPTRIAELLPGPPSTIGTTDASGTGMGGAGFVNTPDGVEPFLWRRPFSRKIQSRLVSYDNPKGTVTNSDLELAATVVHHDVIAQEWHTNEHTIHTMHDNTPAVFWQRKGSVTTDGPAAYLLRLQSHHQREHGYIPRHDYLEGPLNTMADEASPGALANAPRAELHSFSRDLRASQATVRRGVVPGTQRRTDRLWDIWLEFAYELRVDPLLANVHDPIPFLQVFATRYRRRPGTAGQPVRSGTVADALRAVGQTMASLGARDARKDATGSLDFRLSRMLRAFTREDPPPHRVKPIPVSLIRHLAVATQAAEPGIQAVVDMIIIGFFFLLRPGEYTGSDNDDTPFRLQDIQLFVGDRRVDLQDDPVDRIRAATSASLTFTTQKNGVRGEVVNHGCSGHPHLCPVQALIRRVVHLRAHDAPPTTVLASYVHQGRLGVTTARAITQALRAAAVVLGPAYGYAPDDVSARSLRAGGAMALFNSKVDRDTIQLIGRWKSDAMLRYLHLQAQPVMFGFARRMLAGGDYAFHPNHNIPMVPLH